MIKLLKITGLFLILSITSVFGQGGQLQSGQIWGNATASTGFPAGNLLGAYLDRSYCSTQNAILVGVLLSGRVILLFLKAVQLLLKVTRQQALLV